MPNFNPFSDDKEDTSFEHGMPVSQAAKSVAKAVSDQAQKQADDTTKAILDQLYGSSDPSGQDQGTDEANTSHLDHSNASSRAAAHAAGANKTSHSASNSNANPNQTPEEQAKLEKVRHELFANYGSRFKTAQNGPFNITTDIEQEMEKARKEREQKEMQRKQEEEEEERRKKEEEERQKQEVALPAGKKTGVMMGKKQQQPMELQQAKTRTESNRGTTG